MKTSLQKLRMVYSDIIRGFSVLFHEEKSIYIKHLTHIDSANIDTQSEYFLTKAKEKQIPTAEEQEAYLIREGLWDKKKDKEVREQSSYLANLKVTKSKTPLKADREMIQKSIDETEAKVHKLQEEKANLIGFTAETYASKKANEFYIYYSLYADEECKKKYFTHSEFHSLEDAELHALVEKYNASQIDFNAETIKKIAVSPFFSNSFYLCDDRVWDFYGKSITQLSFNQTELFSYGRYFKHILNECRSKIPPHLAEDPNALIDWYERNKNVEKLMKNSGKEDSVSTIVGATKEDLKDMGYQHNVIDLGKEAAKKGGSLSMEDLIRIHNF